MEEGTILIHFVMPFIWPPKENASIFQGVVAGNEFKIIATQNESLEVNISYKYDSLQFETVKLEIKKFGFIKMAISWKDEIEVFLNGKKIPRKGNDPVEITPITGVKLNPRFFLNFQTPKNCSDKEFLFLNTFLDLQEKVSNPGKYNLLKASGLLRQMLIDGTPVVHIINRELRFPISFPVVIDNKPIPVAGSTYQLTNISPIFNSEDELKQVNLDQFLSTTVLQDESNSYSIKDIIKTCANVKGGIHLGKPESEKEFSLEDIDSEFSLFFIDTSLILISDIGWAYLKAVRPLIDEILNKYRNE